MTNQLTDSGTYQARVFYRKPSIRLIHQRSESSTWLFKFKGPEAVTLGFLRDLHPASVDDDPEWCCRDTGTSVLGSGGRCKRW